MGEQGGPLGWLLLEVLRGSLCEQVERKISPVDTRRKSIQGS